MFDSPDYPPPPAGVFIVVGAKEYEDFYQHHWGALN